jgi:hypothetical protein
VELNVLTRKKRQTCKLKRHSKAPGWIVGQISLRALDRWERAITNADLGGFDGRGMVALSASTSGICRLFGW